MAQNWDYAELSKAAKTAGGPEKYVELLEKTSKDAEIKKAKEEIIKGIKEYDATHPDEEGGIENE